MSRWQAITYVHALFFSLCFLVFFFFSDLFFDATRNPPYCKVIVGWYGRVLRASHLVARFRSCYTGVISFCFDTAFPPSQFASQAISGRA